MLLGVQTDKGELQCGCLHILVLETGFSIMYLSEEFLGSHISDLLKCLVISHLSTML